MLNNTDNIYNGVIYFDTDDDFYNFSVQPVVVAREYINPLNQNDAYLDFDFSNAYNDAISNNIAFVIRDKNSQILKHNGLISYRTITKQAKNLKPWYYEKIFNKKQLNECNL